MKRLFIVIAMAALMLSAAIAFARPWGMMGQNMLVSPEQQKFFEETKDLRKEMHDKRFELMELYRTQGADAEKISALEKEINDIRAKIQEKAGEFNVPGGPGLCGNQGGCRNNADNSGCGNCMQNRGCNGRGMGMMQGRIVAK